jgi:hypothetical protein
MRLVTRYSSLVLVALALLAVPAAAQTVIVTDPATQGVFRWDAVPGAERYEIDLGRGEGFQSIGTVTSLKLAADTPNGSYTVTLRSCLSTAAPACSPTPSTLTFVVRRPDPTPPAPTNFRLELTVINNQVAEIKVVPIAPPRE